MIKSEKKYFIIINTSKKKMNNTSPNISILVLFGLLAFWQITTSCNVKRVDTTQTAEQVQAHELKRINAAQITALANNWGVEIVKKLDENATIESLEKEYKAKITTIDLSKPLAQNLDPKEKEVLEAFKYSIENNQTIGANVQKLAGGDIQLFNMPVKGSKSNIWRIEFTKKEIIKRVDVKEIKKLKL